ncbi:hypothetical protein SAMN02745119_01329 [Trichlorobacter thiogenes]|uniref:Uncharacterized protein n=1 Tax=Trichlorobacter thiogenes TaxID=115783 RepID=A0A1T4MK42_9BACT|nr:hypothetical protein [Trichlorobacter thiogenes]SJZ67216.1 hypothetical protein SAMN02745119_01329 [Trichlorobacter thiogenes]
MTEDLPDTEEIQPRSQTMVMLTGLYLFLLLMTLMSYGQPVPLFGILLEGTSARIFIMVDSLVCLHLFLGLLKRQRLTWYLLLIYNGYEVLNTLLNLWLVPHKELERLLERPIDPTGMLFSNLVTVGIILWISWVIQRQREQFTNHSPYLF